MKKTNVRQMTMTAVLAALAFAAVALIRIPVVMFLSSEPKDVVITIGGFKLAVSASREFSALLGIPRSLVYSIAPISGIFIIIAQIINIYEDITGEKVDC